ncbi:hypothetical protein KSP39_PZI009240 [Platanthera zijinensis]|uniref:Uncharacterized protein n=1 Tax=Platanthera zijinensis TaxID=2320716 RepID=A0AAP0BLW3_9ASPA
MSSAVSSPLHLHSLLAPSIISTSASPSSYPSSRSSLQWTNPLRLPMPALLRIPSHRNFLPRAINLSAGNPSDPSRSLNRLVDYAQKLFDDLPQPVKSFPWSRAVKNFFRLIFDLSCAVAKYLSVPVLAISSLSEMSYCGHERKLALVPFPFLIGFLMAGVLSETASELSPLQKEGEFPLHLLLVAIFFLMLKLPGPYYPYWGRLLLPHVGNGGLWRTAWLLFVWYRRIARTEITPVSYDHGDSS